MPDETPLEFSMKRSIPSVGEVKRADETVQLSNWVPLTKLHGNRTVSPHNCSDWYDEKDYKRTELSIPTGRVMEMRGEQNFTEKTFLKAGYYVSCFMAR